MGRAGIEPATLGLRVRPNEQQRAAASRKILQMAVFWLYANCSKLQRTEPKPYAQRYARSRVKRRSLFKEARTHA